MLKMKIHLYHKFYLSQILFHPPVKRKKMERNFAVMKMWQNFLSFFSSTRFTEWISPFSFHFQTKLQIPPTRKLNPNNNLRYLILSVCFRTRHTQIPYQKNKQKPPPIKSIFHVLTSLIVSWRFRECIFFKNFSLPF